MVPQESKLFPIFQVITEKRPCFLFTHQERINWALKGPGLSRFLGDTSYLSRFNKRNWRPLGFGKIPGTQTMSSIPFGRKALLLRSPDRNRKIGLGDALRETSRIKSFLSYAIYYSYVRDIRFYQFYMLFVLISLCWGTAFIAYSSIPVALVWQMVCVYPLNRSLYQSFAAGTA